MKGLELNVTKQNGMTLVEYQLGAADVYDDRVSDKVAQLGNIIPFQYKDEDGKRSIVSYVHHDTSLEVMLRQTLKKADVLAILKGLLCAFEIGAAGVQICYLVRDLKYIYVDPESKAVKCIMVPVKQDPLGQSDIPDFFRNIVSHMRFDEADKDDYVARILTLINTDHYSNMKLKGLVDAEMEKLGLFYTRDEGLKKEADTTAAPEVQNQNVKVNRVGVMNNMRPQGMPAMGQPMGQPVPPMGRQPMGQPVPPMGRQPMGQPVPPMGGQPMMGQPVPPMNGQPMGQPVPPMGGQPMMGQPVPPMNGQPVGTAGTTDERTANGAASTTDGADAEAGNAKTTGTSTGCTKARDAEAGNAKATGTSTGGTKARDAETGNATGTSTGGTKARDAETGNAKATGTSTRGTKARDAETGNTKATDATNGTASSDGRTADDGATSTTDGWTAPSDGTTNDGAAYDGTDAKTTGATDAERQPDGTAWRCTPDSTLCA